MTFPYSHQIWRVHHFSHYGSRHDKGILCLPPVLLGRNSRLEHSRIWTRVVIRVLEAIMERKHIKRCSMGVEVPARLFMCILILVGGERRCFRERLPMVTRRYWTWPTGFPGLHLLVREAVGPSLNGRRLGNCPKSRGPRPHVA